MVGGLGLYFLGAIFWLFVLARVEVSFAYSFVGIGFFLTMVFGRLVMGDDRNMQRVVGTMLIAGCAVLIARGG